MTSVVRPSVRPPARRARRAKSRARGAAPCVRRLEIDARDARRPTTPTDDAARELGKENYFEGGEDAWPAPLREAAAMKPPLALGAYGACVGYLKRLLLDKELVPLGSMATWQPTDEARGLASSPTPVMTMSGLEPAPGP